MSTSNLHYGCGLACNATCCVVFYITDLKDGALRTVGVKTELTPIKQHSKMLL